MVSRPKGRERGEEGERELTFVSSLCFVRSSVATANISGLWVHDVAEGEKLLELLKSCVPLQEISPFYLLSRTSRLTLRFCSLSSKTAFAPPSPRLRQHPLLPHHHLSRLNLNPTAPSPSPRSSRVSSPPLSRPPRPTPPLHHISTSPPPEPPPQLPPLLLRQTPEEQNFWTSSFPTSRRPPPGRPRLSPRTPLHRISSPAQQSNPCPHLRRQPPARRQATPPSFSSSHTSPLPLLRRSHRTAVLHRAGTRTSNNPKQSPRPEARHGACLVEQRGRRRQQQARRERSRRRIWMRRSSSGCRRREKRR